MCCTETASPQSALTYNFTMSYDVLLARSGAAKLTTFGLGAAAPKVDEDDAARDIPEARHEIPIEQPLPPHMPLPLRRPPVVHPHEIPIEEPLSPHMPLRRLHDHSASPIPNARKHQHTDGHHHAAGTPTRKISSSSKFMNAFSQFYGADNSANTDDNNHSRSTGDTANKVQQRSYDDSFPEIKGRVESKLMSMWHNVKYGKYVSIIFR